MPAFLGNHWGINLTTDERRHRLRAPVNRPGRVQFEKQAESNTQIIEVSETGVSVFYSQPVPVGAKAELRFSLTISGEKQSFVASGKVIHHYVRGESHIVGIEFVNPPATLIQAIHAFVAQKLQASG